MNQTQRAELVQKFGGSAANTGKPEVQVSILTYRINELTQHLLTHKQDNHSRRGLIMMVSKRRKLLNYLNKNDIQRYRQIIADLSLRK